MIKTYEDYSLQVLAPGHPMTQKIISLCAQIQERKNLTVNELPEGTAI